MPMTALLLARLRFLCKSTIFDSPACHCFFLQNTPDIDFFLFLAFAYLIKGHYTLSIHITPT